MRCFVAVDIGDKLKFEILPLQKELAGMANVKLVEPENLHFTLKFLGDIDDRMLASAKEMLSKIATGFKPFSAHVRGMGAFPNINYARVVWLGCPDLFNLQRAVDEALSSFFPKEKEINPHLTLARIRSEKGKEALTDFVNRNKTTEINSFRVEEIKLKETTLTPKGPIYENAEIFKLGL